MSDQQQGPGWWLASDGKWYPPEQAPAVPPPETWASPPAEPPPSGGMSSGGKVALALTGVAGVLVLLVVAIAFLGEESNDDPDGGPTETVVDDLTDRGTDDGGSDDGGDDGSSEGGDLPDGYTLIEAGGIAIGAPDGWVELDAADMAMDSEEFGEAFPDAPPGMVEQGLNIFEQGAVLVAFDFTGVTDFSSNLNILDLPGEAPLGAIEGQATSQLATLGGEVIDSGLVDVAAGEALRIEYTLGVTLPDGSVQPAEGVQFYLPVDGRTYIITISTGTGAAALADEMIDTFRVT